MVKSGMLMCLIAVLLFTGCGGGGETNPPTNPPTNSAPDLDADGISDAVDADDDGDGVIDTQDDFPRNASESVDTDGDGTGNNADSDDDNDGVPDTEDDLPLDASDSVDTDGDQIGNTADTDDDNDGVPDTEDDLPLDASDSVDTDGDLIGNTADTDDDNDGVDDQSDLFPLDASETQDSDQDGIGDNGDIYIEHFIYYKGQVGRWNGFYGWDEQLQNYSTSEDGRHVTWSEESTTDPRHETVLRVKFNNDINGNFYIIERFNTPFNFSSYDGGALTFDIRPINYGNSTSDLNVHLDCVWPCTSTNIGIGQPPLDKWTNIRIPLADFVATGLDLGNVNTGLLIAPADGEQQGVEFLLDNVRWESNREVGAIENEGFEEALPSDNINLWDNSLEMDFNYIPVSRWSAYLDANAIATFERATAETGQVRSGNKSLAVTMLAASSSDLAWDHWHIGLLHKDIPVVPGVGYNVSMWFYAEGGPATVKTGVQLPPEQSYVFKAEIEAEIPEGVWTEVSFSGVTMDEGETSVRIPFHMNYETNEGVTLYIDDITFE